MIDISLGKALVPVEEISSCINCYFGGYDVCESPFPCTKFAREDGKTVIFKLVDYPQEEKK